jgi:hypothetical protein
MKGNGVNGEAFCSIGPELEEAVPECKVEYFRTEGGFGGDMAMRGEPLLHPLTSGVRERRPNFKWVNFLL